MALNFIVFWVVPMVGQGSLFKLVTAPYLTPVYDRLDQSPWLRWFAERFIYEKPKYADFFATQLLFVLNFVPLIAFTFYVQFTLRGLPWWVTRCVVWVPAPFFGGGSLLHKGLWGLGLMF